MMGLCFVGAHWGLKHFLFCPAPPRALEVGGFVSVIIDPGCSILAGCMQSMSWVEIYVYELLDVTHVHDRPVHVKAYVDDITPSMVGQHEQVLSSLVPAAVNLAHQ
eukprot:1166966-Pyramimonas_sp.AAC.1